MATEGQCGRIAFSWIFIWTALSGIELRRQLKRSHPDLPVIFMTALDDEAVRHEALEAGCVTFLHKPFPAHQLIEAIKRAVPPHAPRHGQRANGRG